MVSIIVSVSANVWTIVKAVAVYRVLEIIMSIRTSVSSAGVRSGVGLMALKCT